jgi:preprotein translocase subunit SecF
MVGLLVIALMGGEATQNFAVAMILGVAFGTYSSFGVAAPIYVFLKERSAKKARLHGTAVAA